MENPLPQTCLSTEPHSDRVLDVTLHYFGCLKASEQSQFLSTLPKKSQRRIANEKQRIRRTRTFLEGRPRSEPGVALKKFKESLTDWRRHAGRRIPEHGIQWPLDKEAGGSVDADVKAAMIYFKEGRPYDIPDVENEFPNQKIAVKDLLVEDKKRNPLMQPCIENSIRYFHFPVNNMAWVEEAIARYYHEERPNTSEFFVRSRPKARSKTQELLRPELWRGQQHGDRTSEVHARFMRPLCEGIRMSSTSSGSSPNNLVLFMPYLHWETDRGRTKSATVIKEAGESNLSTLIELVDQVKAHDHVGPQPPLTIDHGLNTFASDQTLSISSPTRSGRPQRRVALGKMLRLAASLFETMDSYLDEKLIYEYLHEDPPLHPRRTLDQSYYGALKNTQTRDRDQVVYRATTPEPHTCRVKRDHGCASCQENIRKVPRLIMVDQLWLWILDDTTIISCFPRRWGRNKADPSAVHKSLRTRLKTAREDEIRTAFDLALIIVDECSRVFFDRTKPIDRQPNVVDIFADAIRGVTYKQTAAFDQFLTYTHLASKEYSSRDRKGTSATQNTLLNINPEGKLLKEVKDILDELHILTRIKIQQQIVAESFVEHIKNALRPKLSSGANIYLSSYAEAGMLRPGNAGLVQKEEVESAKWTLARADSLLKAIQDRISELTTLEDAAKNTSIALKDLLTLKQQQAGVVEAREAVKQATETLKQGRSIMLFTVVTIVFAPLSFCASVFGMNTLEFNGSKLSFREQSYYMFPISVAIIFTSFLLAFSSSTFFSALCSLFWATVSYPFNVATTWVLTKTGVYTLSREMASRANALREKDRKETATMKANALREKMELRAMKEIWKDEEGIEMQENVKGTMSDVESGRSSRSEMRLYRN